MLANFGPKTTPVFIRQRVLRRDPGRMLIVEHTSDTPKVPSGDCFRVVNRYAIGAVAPGRTRVVLTGAIQFLKSTYFRCMCPGEGQCVCALRVRAEGCIGRHTVCALGARMGRRTACSVLELHR
jgi:hypothetical protein